MLGMAVLGVIEALLGQVAEAVEKVGEVLGEFLTWLATFVETVVRVALAVFVEPLQTLVLGYAEGVATVLLAAREEFELTETLSDDTLGGLNAAFTGTLFWVLLGASVALYAALLVLLPFTLSFSFVVTFVVSIVVTVIVVETLNHDGAAPERSLSSPGFAGPQSWAAEAESLLEAQPEWPSQSEFYRNVLRTLLAVFGFYLSKTGLTFMATAILDAEIPFSRGQVVGIVVGLLGLALLLAVIGGQVTNEEWVVPLSIVALVLGIGSLLLSAFSFASLPQGQPRYLALAGLALSILGIILSIAALLV